LVLPAFDEEVSDALFLRFCDDFGGGGEQAVDGVVDDFGYGFFRLLVGGGLDGGWFGEVQGGDLQAVEEQAGAARVEGVFGYAGEDFADGVLDGAAVFGSR